MFVGVAVDVVVLVGVRLGPAVGDGPSVGDGPGVGVPVGTVTTTTCPTAGAMFGSLTATRQSASPSGCAASQVTVRVPAGLPPTLVSTGMISEGATRTGTPLTTPPTTKLPVSTNSMQLVAPSGHCPVWMVPLAITPGCPVTGVNWAKKLRSGWRRRGRDRSG